METWLFLTLFFGVRYKGGIKGTRIISLLPNGYQAGQKSQMLAFHETRKFASWKSFHICVLVSVLISLVTDSH
jgi:hypothetical protein